VGRDPKSEIVALYDAFFEKVYRYCAYRLHSKEFAEDATSSVFVRLVECYPAIRKRGDTWIRNWLFGTASNIVTSYQRQALRNKRAAEGLSQERGLPRDEIARAEEQLDQPKVYDAIQRLSPSQQAVVVLRHMEGLESSAIAKALGMTRIGVRVRLYRAMKALRRELGVTHG
jgi:RNA polymerase sigma-70 factor, ECF subfamily